MSWAERFAENAAAHGDRDAIRVPGRSWTFAELDAGARRIAGELTGLGVRPGTMAAIAIARGPAFVFALCGAKRAGAVPVLIDPTDPDLASAACARLGVAAALVDAADPAGRAIAPPGPLLAVGTGDDLAVRARGRPLDAPRVL